MNKIIEDYKKIVAGNEAGKNIQDVMGGVNGGADVYEKAVGEESGQRLSYNDANAIGGTCVDVIFSKYNQ